MIKKQQIIVIIVSFIIAGLFLSSLPRLTIPAYAGGVCCIVDVGPALCTVNIFECTEERGGEDCGGCAPPGDPCLCSINPPPQIPTLNQWGTFMMAGVLGLFAVIGLFAMRRRNAVTR